jgi:hypothetical protein
MQVCQRSCNLTLLQFSSNIHLQHGSLPNSLEKFLLAKRFSFNIYCICIYPYRFRTLKFSWGSKILCIYPFLHICVLHISVLPKYVIPIPKVRGFEIFCIYAVFAYIRFAYIRSRLYPFPTVYKYAIRSLR